MGSAAYHTMLDSGQTLLSARGRPRSRKLVNLHDLDYSFRRGFMESGARGKNDDARKATVPAEPVGRPPAEARPGDPYLLVFEGDSSWVFPLRVPADVVVGRAESAGLRVRDPAVSRMHARLTVTAEEALLRDLRSQNGTFVNGERVVGTRPLVSGDTIVLCGVTLVFHGGQRRAEARPLADLALLRRRAEEEIERSQSSRRPWFVAALHLGPGVDRARASEALRPGLRRLDVAAWGGAELLLVLLPETDSEEARSRVARLLEALRPIAPEVRAGFAGWPHDGVDVDTLLAGARTAALSARAPEPAHAAENYRRVPIGDREAIVADPAMIRVFGLLERVAAASDMSVLLFGETGSGKDLAAHALHLWSPRRDRPFVALNCAAIPEALVESELFGYEKGAFTGATGPKTGLLEAADGGTLFLDEVGDLPMAAQAKLLRAIESRRLRALGDVREREIDVRIVAATHRNLEDEVRAGRFRQDLYFRLKGATIWIPPLRDRKGEIPILARAFLAAACHRAGRPPMELSQAAIEALMLHPWAGNVRELQSFVEYAVAVAKGPLLEGWHLEEWARGAPPSPEETPPPIAAHRTFRPIEEEIRELERTRMTEALAATGGNRTRAAQLIGMPLRTFTAKLKAYSLQEIVNGRGNRREP